MKLLLNAETLESTPVHRRRKARPPCHSPLGDLFLPLEGLVDVAAEKARLTKELEKIEAEIAQGGAEADNPNFTQKAPPQVLDEHKQRLAEWQASATTPERRWRC